MDCGAFADHLVHRRRIATRQLAGVVLQKCEKTCVFDQVKFAFHRGRPVWEDPLITIATPSFPSGHAAAATLFYGFLCVYIVSHVESLGLRVAAVLAGITMVLLVAFSRMYLGVHYPSDVLAAISASTAWLVVSLGSVRAYLKRHAAA